MVMNLVLIKEAVTTKFGIARLLRTPQVLFLCQCESLERQNLQNASRCATRIIDNKLVHLKNSVVCGCMSDDAHRAPAWRLGAAWLCDGFCCYYLFPMVWVCDAGSRALASGTM